MMWPWTWTHTSSPCQGFAFEGLGKACWRWKRFFGNQLHCKLLNFFVQVSVGVLGSDFSELYCVCTNASFNGDQLSVWVFAAVCKRISGVPTFRSVKWTASTQLQACLVHTLFADWRLCGLRSELSISCFTKQVVDVKSSPDDSMDPFLWLPTFRMLSKECPVIVNLVHISCQSDVLLHNTCFGNLCVITHSTLGVM
jgi:hypothetical protein